MRTLLRRAERAIRGFARQVAPPPDSQEGKLPEWSALLQTNPALWGEAVRKAASGPRVLVATYVGGYPQFTVLESALAVALTLRGARVSSLLCDEALPGCLRAKVTPPSSPEVLERYELPQTLCRACVHRGRVVFGPLGLDTMWVGGFLGPDEKQAARETAARLPLAEIPGFEIDGLPIGEHAMAGALRYFGRGDIDGTPRGEVVVRRYLEASILSARSLQRQLQAERYDAAIINHGIYVPQGITAAVCRAAGVRVVTWNLAYRKQCAIFSHDDTYHHTLMAEPTREWDGMEWSESHEQAILSYLGSRQKGMKKGTRDWIWFNQSPDEDVDQFASWVGLDWGKPVIGLLTNVIWDAQLHYPANAFSGIVEWVVRTIGYFERRPDLQLLIRIHPAELSGATRSRQPMVDEIAKAFPKLPKNVFVVPPESPLSTYAAMQRCDSVLIYGTKTGVELTSLGVPVIVAGEAWIRNKGLTLDASTADEYFRHLDRLPLGRRMDPETVARARRYAYHFFFRRMIPLPFLTPSRGWPPFEIGIGKLDELLPGVHPGLDVICEGVLNGTPFVYPAERLGLHDS